jgi:hypothetical protein
MKIHGGIRVTFLIRGTRYRRWAGIWHSIWHGWLWLLLAPAGRRACARPPHRSPSSMAAAPAPGEGEAAAVAVQGAWRHRARARRPEHGIRRRCAVAREIYASELSYLQGLAVLDGHYMQQLLWQQANTLADRAARLHTAVPCGGADGGGAAREEQDAAAQDLQSPSLLPKDADTGAEPAQPPAAAQLSMPEAQGPTSDDMPTAAEVDAMFGGGTLMCLLDLSRQLTQRLSERVGCNGEHWWV